MGQSHCRCDSWKASLGDARPDEDARPDLSDTWVKQAAVKENGSQGSLSQSTPATGSSTPPDSHLVATLERAEEADDGHSTGAAACTDSAPSSLRFAAARFVSRDPDAPSLLNLSTSAGYYDGHGNDGKGTTQDNSSEAESDAWNANAQEATFRDGSLDGSDNDSFSECPSSLSSPSSPSGRTPRKRREDATGQGDKGAGRRASQLQEMAIDNHLKIRKCYEMKGKALVSDGSLGSLRKAINIATGAVRAVKTLTKIPKENEKKIEYQIEVLRKLDHPNIMMLREIFEDKKNVYLVVDACLGGTLHDRMSAAEARNTTISEVQAALVMRQVFRAISYMHESCICHRDICPKNILLTVDRHIDTQTLVKVAAFRSPFCFGRRSMTGAVGTPASMAPEMLAGKYTKSCDLWSCGIMLFELLCGYIPLEPKDGKEILTPRRADAKRKSLVLHNEILAEKPGNASEQGQDLIEQLVRTDPKARFTAYQALHHKWMSKAVPKLTQAAWPAKSIEQLKAFRNLNKLKQSALHMIASILSEEETASARTAFLSLDIDGDGVLSISEFKDALEQDKSLDDRKRKSFSAEAETIFTATSSAGARYQKGFAYTEFVAATFDRNSLTDDVCRAAFKCFDRNSDGNISISELSIGFHLDALSLEELGNMIEELDINGDNYIDFEEFKRMLHSTE